MSLLDFPAQLARDAALDTDVEFLPSGDDDELQDLLADKAGEIGLVTPDMVESLVVSLELLALDEAVAHYDPDKHPRWPAGTPGGLGGKFMHVGQRFSMHGVQYDVAAVFPGHIYAHVATHGVQQAPKTIEIKADAQVLGDDGKMHPSISAVERPEAEAIHGTKTQTSSATFTGTVVDPYVETATHDPSIPIPEGSKVTPEQWKRFGKLDQERYSQVMELFGPWSPGKAQTLVDGILQKADPTAKKILMEQHGNQIGTSTGITLSMHAVYGAVLGLFKGHPTVEKARTDFEAARALQDETAGALQWDLYNRAKGPDIALFHRNSTDALFKQKVIAGNLPVFSGLSQSQKWSESHNTGFGSNTFATPMAIRNIVMSRDSANINKSSGLHGELEVATADAYAADARSMSLTPGEMSSMQRKWLTKMTKDGASGDIIATLKESMADSGSSLPVPAADPVIQMDGTGGVTYVTPPIEATKGAETFGYSDVDENGVPIAKAAKDLNLKPGDYIEGMKGTRYIIVADPSYALGISYFKITDSGTATGPSNPYSGEIHDSTPQQAYTGHKEWTGSAECYQFGGTQPGLLPFKKLNGHYVLPVSSAEFKSDFHPDAWAFCAKDDAKLLSKFADEEMFHLDGVFYKTVGQLGGGLTRIQNLSTGNLGKINSDYKSTFLVLKPGYSASGQVELSPDDFFSGDPVDIGASLDKLTTGSVFKVGQTLWKVDAVTADGHVAASQASGAGKNIGKLHTFDATQVYTPMIPKPLGWTPPEIGDTLAVDGKKATVTKILKSGEVQINLAPGVLKLKLHDPLLAGLFSPNKVKLGEKVKLKQMPEGTTFHGGTGVKTIKPYMVGPTNGNVTKVLNLDTGESMSLSANKSFVQLVPKIEPQAAHVEPLAGGSAPAPDLFTDEFIADNWEVGPEKAAPDWIPGDMLMASGKPIKVVDVDGPKVTVKDLTTGQVSSYNVGEIAELVVPTLQAKGMGEMHTASPIAPKAAGGPVLPSQLAKGDVVQIPTAGGGFANYAVTDAEPLPGVPGQKLTFLGIGGDDDGQMYGQDWTDAELPKPWTLVATGTTAHVGAAAAYTPESSHLWVKGMEGSAQSFAHEPVGTVVLTPNGSVYKIVGSKVADDSGIESVVVHQLDPPVSENAPTWTMDPKVKLTVLHLPEQFVVTGQLGGWDKPPDSLTLKDLKPGEMATSGLSGTEWVVLGPGTTPGYVTIKNVQTGDVKQNADTWTPWKVKQFVATPKVSGGSAIYASSLKHGDTFQKDGEVFVVTKIWGDGEGTVTAVSLTAKLPSGFSGESSFSGDELVGKLPELVATDFHNEGPITPQDSEVGDLLLAPNGTTVWKVAEKVNGLPKCYLVAGNANSGVQVGELGPTLAANAEFHKLSFLPAAVIPAVEPPAESAPIMATAFNPALYLETEPGTYTLGELHASEIFKGKTGKFFQVEKKHGANVYVTNLETGKASKLSASIKPGALLMPLHTGNIAHENLLPGSPVQLGHLLVGDRFVKDSDVYQVHALAENSEDQVTICPVLPNGALGNPSKAGNAPMLLVMFKAKAGEVEAPVPAEAMPEVIDPDSLPYLGDDSLDDLGGGAGGYITYLHPKSGKKHYPKIKDMPAGTVFQDKQGQVFKVKTSAGYGSVVVSDGEKNWGVNGEWRGFVLDDAASPAWALGDADKAPVAPPADHDETLAQIVAPKLKPNPLKTPIGTLGLGVGDWFTMTGIDTPFKVISAYATMHGKPTMWKAVNPVTKQEKSFNVFAAPTAYWSAADVFDEAAIPKVSNLVPNDDGVALMDLSVGDHFSTSSGNVYEVTGFTPMLGGGPPQVETKIVVVGSGAPGPKTWAGDGVPGYVESKHVKLAPGGQTYEFAQASYAPGDYETVGSAYLDVMDPGVVYIGHGGDLWGVTAKDPDGTVYIKNLTKDSQVTAVSALVAKDHTPGMMTVVVEKPTQHTASPIANPSPLPAGLDPVSLKGFTKNTVWSLADLSKGDLFTTTSAVPGDTDTQVWEVQGPTFGGKTPIKVIVGKKPGQLTQTASSFKPGYVVYATAKTDDPLKSLGDFAKNDVGVQVKMLKVGDQFSIKPGDAVYEITGHEGKTVQSKIIYPPMHAGTAANSDPNWAPPFIKQAPVPPQAPVVGPSADPDDYNEGETMTLDKLGPGEFFQSMTGSLFQVVQTGGPGGTSEVKNLKTGKTIKQALPSMPAKHMVPKDLSGYTPGFAPESGDDVAVVEKMESVYGSVQSVGGHNFGDMLGELLYALGADNPNGDLSVKLDAAWKKNEPGTWDAAVSLAQQVIADAKGVEPTKKPFSEMNVGATFQASGPDGEPAGPLMLKSGPSGFVNKATGDHSPMPDFGSGHEYHEITDGTESVTHSHEVGDKITFKTFHASGPSTGTVELLYPDGTLKVGGLESGKFVYVQPEQVIPEQAIPPTGKKSSSPMAENQGMTLAAPTSIPSNEAVRVGDVVQIADEPGAAHWTVKDITVGKTNDGQAHLFHLQLLKKPSDPKIKQAAKVGATHAVTNLAGWTLISAGAKPEMKAGNAEVGDHIDWPYAGKMLSGTVTEKHPNGAIVVNVDPEHTDFDKPFGIPPHFKVEKTPAPTATPFVKASSTQVGDHVEWIDADDNEQLSGEVVEKLNDGVLVQLDPKYEMNFTSGVPNNTDVTVTTPAQASTTAGIDALNDLPEPGDEEILTNHPMSLAALGAEIGDKVWTFDDHPPVTVTAKVKMGNGDTSYELTYPDGHTTLVHGDWQSSGGKIEKAAPSNPLVGYMHPKSGKKHYPKLGTLAPGTTFHDKAKNLYVVHGPAQTGYVTVEKIDAGTTFVVSEDLRVFQVDPPAA